MARSRHAPPQSVRPEPHEVSQVPPAHTVPVAQTWPQLPQSPLLVVRSRQIPVQFVRPPPHDVWHVPMEQTSPVPQG